MSTQYIADDKTAIGARLAELEGERLMARDLNLAKDGWLDLHGRRAGLDRQPGETDFAYRVRIKAKGPIE